MIEPSPIADWEKLGSDDVDERSKEELKVQQWLDKCREARIKHGTV